MAQEEDAAVRPRREALHAVPAQEGTGGDGVRLQLVEAGAGVRVSRGGDVPALGVQENRLAKGVDKVDQGAKRMPTGGAAGLVEGGVGLEGAGEGVRGFHHRAHAREDFRSRDIKGGVETDAKKGFGAARFAFQKVEEAVPPHLGSRL